MINVTTKELLAGVCARMGIDPDSAELDQGLALQIGAALDERVRQAYQREMWPFVCVYQRRQWAQSWDVAETYAAGDVVQDEYGVSVSQLDANVGHAPTGDDGTNWLSIERHQAANPDFQWRNQIEFSQAWDPTGFDEVSRVWDADPLSVATAQELGYTVTADGIVVMGSPVPLKVYQLERPWPPRVAAGPNWSATSYGAGDLVYYPTDGKTYEAAETCAAGDVPGTSSKWVEQQVPKQLKPFVVHAAYADTLRADGQIERAMNEGKVAMAILNDIADRVFVGQQQTQRAVVV